MTEYEAKKAEEIANFAIQRGLSDPEKIMKAWFKNGADFVTYFYENQTQINATCLTMADNQ